MAISVATLLPLTSALVWFAIAVSQMRGGTVRASTGAAFVATAFLISLYALWDGLGLAFSMSNFLHSLIPSPLILALASLMFLYFAKWLARGRRWSDGILAVPVVLLALPSILDLLPFLPPAWLDLPFLSQVLALVPGNLERYSTALIILFILGGINFLRQGALLAVDVMGRESWAIIAIMAAASLVLAFAILVLANPYLNVLSAEVTPPGIFSSSLVVPGIMLLAALRRGRAIGVLKLFNLKESYQGETLAVYLTHKSGNLIGAVPMQGEAMDDDVFVGTFDAFQSFFNHALPFLKGHTLRIATFGEIAVIMERGQYCYLTVVTTSKRLGLIRETMRHQLRWFEGLNARHLRDWDGLLDVLAGREDILRGFLPEGEMGRGQAGIAEVAGW